MHLRFLNGLFSFAGLLLSSFTAVHADDWPQWMGPQRDGIYREAGLLEKFPAGGPKVVWRTPIGGGYAGPAVAKGCVVVTDKQRPSGASDPTNPFDRKKTGVTERVVCLNSSTGAVKWKHEYPCEYSVSYPAGPRTTPVIRDGRIFTLGSEGDLKCLNFETGDVIWSRNFKTEFQRPETHVWGYSSNPVLEGDLLYCLVGGKGSTIVAFDKETGKTVWQALDSAGRHGPGYGTPILIEAAGRKQLIVWHPTAVSSLNPLTGDVLWEQPFAANEGLTVATPRYAQGNLFISSFYNGAMLLKVDQEQPGARIVWKRAGSNERQTDSLHSLITTPVLDGQTIFGVDSYGELRGINLANGDRLWSTFAATSGQSARWGTAFIVKLGETGDRYLLFSEQGDLIICRMTADGFTEISRAHVIEPTGPAQRRDVVWTHPAYAHRHAFVRNDKEIVCISLEK